MASSSNHFKSREAFKAAKELEEARKAGTAPPAVDSDGKIINPHIPEYISQAPWYLQQDGPSLKHQKTQKPEKRKFSSLGDWLPRGQFKGPAATKFRKGACENCGAMTHTAKTCLERPRRRGAKLTGKAIRPDEAVGAVDLDFEGKRDRWNGYDEASFNQVHRRFAKLEEARKAVKAERLDKELSKPTESERIDSDDEDHDDEGAVLQQTGEAAKMSVRNLRIREDTAKYLYNLDLDSAYYDPKSRSMRADPRPKVDPVSKDYTGDNFIRYSGDVSRLAEMELHSLKAKEIGRAFPHLQAEPSRAEALFKEFETKSKTLKEKQQADIFKKYGGQEHLSREPGMEVVNQNEAYHEYTREGKLVNGSTFTIPFSKYPEDVLDKNHSSIWGSFYKDGKWGYDCCRQLYRYAYCTGEDGKRAAEETEKEMKVRTMGAVAKRDQRSLTSRWHERVEKELPPNVDARSASTRDEKIEHSMGDSDLQSKERT